MHPTLKLLTEKKLVGKRITMSLTANRTAELWRALMPHRTEVNNSNGSDLYSLQIYPPRYFDNFNPDTSFEKWALIEVEDFSSVPKGMEAFTLPGGLYAVFLYRGPASEGARLFQYIYGTWLPQSGYVLDDRPHFEVLGVKYTNDGPQSEEEIWIPVSEGKSSDQIADSFRSGG